MIARAAHLAYHQEVDPTEIFLLAFNNKAAKELQTRWHAIHEKHFQPDEIKQHPTPTFSTLHSFGYRVGTRACGKHRSIMSEYQAVRLAQQVLSDIVGDKVKMADVMPVVDAYEQAVADMTLHYFAVPIINESGELVRVVNPQEAQTDEQAQLAIQTLDTLSRPTLDKVALSKGQESPNPIQSIDGHRLPKAQTVHLEIVTGLVAQMVKSSRISYSQFFKFVQEYLKAKYSIMSLDFSDMAYWTILYLASNPKALHQTWLDHSHLIVDESQDLDTSQFALVSLVSARNAIPLVVNNTTILKAQLESFNAIPRQDGPLMSRVGISFVFDPKQTLYQWRNANPYLVDRLQHILPDVQVSSIEHNYRSPEQLVKLSNYFAESFETLTAIPAIPFHPKLKGSLESHEFEVAYNEYQWIATQVQKMIETHEAKPKDIMILARSNRVLDMIEPALVTKRIPYRVRQGDRRFTNSSSYKLIYGLLSILMNPKDFLAFGGFLTAVKGFGTSFIKTLITEARTHYDRTGKTLSVLEHSDVQTVRNSKQRDQYKQIHKLVLQPLKSIFQQEGQTLPNLMDHLQAIIEKNFILKNPAFTPNSAQFSLDVEHQSLVRAVRFFVTMYNGMLADDPQFQKASETERMFMIYPILQTSQEEDVLDEDGTPNKVTLSSIHSAKGLESPYVFFAGINSLGHTRREEEEAERCCFYVAITRASKRLILTHSAKAPDYSNFLRKTIYNPFLEYYLNSVRRLQAEYLEEAKKAQLLTNT